MENRLKELIESLIFVSSEPLSTERIKIVLEEFSEEEIEQVLQKLVASYASDETGIEITRSAGSYLFSTKPDFDPWIRRLLRIERKNKLSSAALETLSAIAYDQPATLAEISALRGVDSTHTLKVLLQRKLIKIVGRKKSPGRPLIYRTTDKFLTYFGLNNIKELPTEEEISKILEEEKIER